MELDKLRIITPLGLKQTTETDWVKVSNYKFLRLTACSDTNISIEVLFSHNAFDIGPITTLKQGKMWSTRRVDILLDWMKIKVINEQPIENKFLIINALGRRDMGPSIDLPKSIDSMNELPKPLVENDETAQEETRAKSPFKKGILRGFVNRKKSDGIVKSVSFDRLPAFVPKNGLLAGAFSNNLVAIPPPPVDKMSFLICKDGVIQWVELEQDKSEWKI